MSVSDTGLRFRDSLVIKAESAKDGTLVGQRTSDEDGRQSGVDFDEYGRARLTAYGVPRQNEAGAKVAIQRLAAELHRRGEIPDGTTVVMIASSDRTTRQDVDGEIRTVPEGKSATLVRAQHTRAGDSLHLRELGRRRNAASSTEASIDELADLLMVAIKNKHKHYWTGVSDVQLVLDAIDHHASLATEPIVQSFQRRHLQEVRRVGFEKIWLVGPMSIFRLDE